MSFCSYCSEATDGTQPHESPLTQFCTGSCSRSDRVAPGQAVQHWRFSQPAVLQAGLYANKGHPTLLLPARLTAAVVHAVSHASAVTACIRFTGVARHQSATVCKVRLGAAVPESVTGTVGTGQMLPKCLTLSKAMATAACVKPCRRSSRPWPASHPFQQPAHTFATGVGTPQPLIRGVLLS